MEVKGVITRTPCNVALICAALFLISLTLNADVHEVISANGAVILLTFPFPHCHCVPFLDRELIFG